MFGPNIAELPLIDQPHLEKRPRSGAIPVFYQNVLQVVAKDIAFVNQQIFHGAVKFPEFRTSGENVCRLGPSQRFSKQAMARVDDDGPEGGAHVDEIHHRIARDRKDALLPTINIGDMVNLLPDPVAKQGSVHEDELPKEAVRFEEWRQIKRIGQHRVADSDIRDHVGHRAVSGGVDGVDDWRPAITNEGVFRSEPTLPPLMLPALKRRANNPAGFLANSLKEASGKILPHCDAFRDVFSGNLTALRVATHHLSLDRIFNETRPKAHPGKFHSHKVILRQTSIGKWHAVILLRELIERFA